MNDKRRTPTGNRFPGYPAPSLTGLLQRLASIAPLCLALCAPICPALAQHPDDPDKQQEHMALFDLVPHADATHVSAADGLWTDPATWQGNAVPSAGARVWIDPAHTVTFDAPATPALEWLRVDGVITFKRDADTRLLTELFVIDPGGTLNIGTEGNPMDPGHTAEILIDTTGGPIDAAEDPLKLGRGMIPHGRTRIFGAAKTPHTTLSGDAYGGDAHIELVDSSIPAGWAVGDVLLLAGTDADMDAGLFGRNSSSIAEDATNERFRDEILEITAMNVVDGRVRVSFLNRTNPDAIAAGRTTLLWDHDRPDGALFDPSELEVHVANLTRNVVVRSSDPTVPIQERGHFMVMHNPDARIYHMQCKDLGRTDKSVVVDDPAALGNLDGTPGAGTNPRGRYGLHLHRVGAQTLGGTRAEVVGNVVWGSPGWGIVHHDSYALLEGNVVFDVTGAGIVAEDGNEIGEWRDNLVVKATGEPGSDFDDNHIVSSGRGPRFDLGFVGSGYWIQGGAGGLLLDDNIAVSCNAAGFDIVP